MIDTEEKTIELLVHSIRMGDVEDPDLFVGQPIYDWQQTEAGKYVMENSVPTPLWRRTVDPDAYGHKYMIFAYFTPEQITYYKLKHE
jgi:hypothetical protein